MSWKYTQSWTLYVNSLFHGLVIFFVEALLGLVFHRMHTMRALCYLSCAHLICGKVEDMRMSKSDERNILLDMGFDVSVGSINRERGAIDLIFYSLFRVLELLLFL